jgi:putative oxidoreductase
MKSNKEEMTMSIAKLHNLFVLAPGRLLGNFESVLLLGLRLWVSTDFLKSGWLKITNWQNTVFLFHNEYHVPVLPPTLAAITGTAGELVFPALLIVGLAGRLSAVGLFAVNVMAVVSYAHVLLTEGFEAAVGQHYMWGMALLVLSVFGPGRVSLDHLLGPRAGSVGAPRMQVQAV